MTGIALTPPTTPATALPAPPRPAVKQSRSRAALKVGKVSLFYLVLTAVAAMFMVPYVFTLFGSLKPASLVVSQSPWIPPYHLEFSNYSNTLFYQNYDFIRYLGNTAFVTLVLVTGQVFFSVLGAYAFARLQFPGRDFIFWIYLCTLMVPSIVTIIPLYTMIHYAHLVNTYWAIFLPYVFGTPYTIFLMRQFFRNIPQEVIDAAKIDGCSDVGVLRRVVVPLSRPVIITATLIAFVFSWNNFLWPLLVSNTQTHFLLTTGISNFFSSYGQDWNYSLAGAMITLLPLIVIFAVFQRYIIRSIQLTAGR